MDKSSSLVVFLSVLIPSGIVVCDLPFFFMSEGQQGAMFLGYNWVTAIFYPLTWHLLWCICSVQRQPDTGGPFRTMSNT